MSHVAAVPVAARVILQLLIRMQKASLPRRTAAVLYSRTRGHGEAPLLQDRADNIPWRCLYPWGCFRQGCLPLLKPLQAGKQSQTCLPCCCHPVTVLPSPGLPSLTMKATFSAALLVLAISAWTSVAVGELHVLALSTFSAIDLTYGKISGASAM